MTARADIVNAITVRVRAAVGPDVRVYPSRIQHIQTGRLPAIGVYAMKEKANDEGTSPRRYTRTLSIAVECVATADERLDEVLYALADTVEAALLQDPTLNGLVDDLVLDAMEMHLAERGEALLGCARVECSVEYERVLPAVGLDDFRKGGVRWDKAEPGPDGTTDAEDIINLPAP